ncbi:uncharacterized protein BDZ99DRAFT_469365 [Mytilinidion resinicola]|uniref:DUF3844 domain-containing protein n=1 Tax=Mytilinidion resinicola TaxID=574789 RepID=A0A6A6XZA8_9PEZI|nr:uncharacterized protein BDZ99DRAFT_469365 [Mytilinidion resinicola]KAF2801852.1 hypothetical protein BDZ99DRAFT_469365 [Mytilinidion resinicola]
MKPSWGLVLSSLCCAASAASKSPVGHVYAYDSAIKSKDTTQESLVTAETARLIIAQRLGLSRFHSLDDADEDVVQQLNRYGGRALKLFGGDRESNHAHALIWLDAVIDPQDIIPESDLDEYSHFTLSNPASSSANKALVYDFYNQAKYLPKRRGPQLISHESDDAISTMLDSEMPVNHISISHNKVPKSEPVVSADFMGANDYRKGVSQVLSAAKRLGFSFTVVLTPPGIPKSKKHPYGTYTIPTHHLEKRRQVPEAILSSSAAVASNAANAINNTETTPNLPLAKDGPLLGILKSCYASQSACESATRNCTGHGACYLSRHGEERSGGKGKFNDCYSCACKATVVERGEGKGHKTTNWGGPACQKKDVVVEFWLFAGATVMLMFLVGTGIGMLYSMGEEELPSVIGAGVSGPTRK